MYIDGFNKEARLYTDNGCPRLSDLDDGEEITVYGGDGRPHLAQVFFDGIADTCKVTLSQENDCDIDIVCTPSHKWKLEDKTFVATDELEVGAVLARPKYYGEEYPKFTVSNIEPNYSEEEIYAIEEPETHAVILTGCVITGDCA